MGDAKLVSIDPGIETPTPADRDQEQREHIGTYNRFVHIAMAFILHLPLLLGGLYAMTLDGAMILGALLTAAGIAVLIFGMTWDVSRPA